MDALLSADNRDYYFDRRENVKGSVATQHYHSSFELYYMKSGKCSYFIHDRSYDIVSGDVILIPAGTIHRTNYGAKPHSRLLINFREDYVSSAMLEGAISLGYLYRNKELSGMIEAPEAKRLQVLLLFYLFYLSHTRVLFSSRTGTNTGDSRRVAPSKVWGEWSERYIWPSVPRNSIP